jgi:hypothetical protein
MQTSVYCYHAAFDFNDVFFEHLCVSRHFIKMHVIFIKESRGGICRQEFPDTGICLSYFYISIFALCPYIAQSHVPLFCI